MKILCFVFFFTTHHEAIYIIDLLWLCQKKKLVLQNWFIVSVISEFYVLWQSRENKVSCTYRCWNTFSTQRRDSQNKDKKKSRPSWTLEIQRNIRNFRTECHIPLQLTEPSLPECLPSGSAAQWEQIARDTKSDTGDRGGGQTEETVSGRCSQTITSPICQ